MFSFSEINQVCGESKHKKPPGSGSARGEEVKTTATLITAPTLHFTGADRNRTGIVIETSAKIFQEFGYVSCIYCLVAVKVTVAESCIGAGVIE